MLSQALQASRRKIIVFLFVVLTLVVIFGSLIYLIEDLLKSSRIVTAKQLII